MKKADIGLIGLAVMGENLARNMENHGFTVAVFNRSTAAVDAFVERFPGKNFIATHSLEELVASLAKPRKVFMMIKAGNPVDGMIDKLIPLLEEGDVIIDGGNSNFNDTRRTSQYVESKGLNYIGCGVSGGEEGALNGPSLMPGGTNEGFAAVKDILQSICAKVNGEPCCDYVGEDGAGHYVKMVHNGIEYGDMQLIAETYAILKKSLNLSNDELYEIFKNYNDGKLSSYLIEITYKIFGYKAENGEEVIDKILGAAGQKGTGKWAVMDALDEGIPLTMIGEAVFARCLSSLVDTRAEIADAFDVKCATPVVDKAELIKIMENALYAAKILSYTQGYQLMAEAAKTYNWNLNFGQIALMWRGGCIIRSEFLGKIKEAYVKNPALSNLLLDDFFNAALKEYEKDLRYAIKLAIDCGIAVPSFSAALAYFDGMRTTFSPANLIQAQRDFFGAHTYERVDKPRGEIFHTNWTGEGGSTTARDYKV
ncbi:MAG: decarboxylating NADP(+)-dependent phosphogluconate dehydrogenase [Clostridia bacterium]|nr:decarboxylating NADP(+)-dependent phosphogluconate dehydrogenase [Clostridia bacterium]